MITRDDLMAALTERARNDDRVLGLFLGGSLGAGEGDAWSDADLIAAVAPEHHAGFVAEARAWAEVTPLVLWKPPYQDRWRPLLDRAELSVTLPASLPLRQPKAEQVEAAVVEFLRVLGLAAVVLGRHEFAVGVTGAAMLRQQLIALMLMALDLPQPPGALHLSRLLSPEDMATLDALPCPAPAHDAVLEAHTALAAAFLPRARRLAERVGAPWPEALERATRLHLGRTLGVRWPD